MDLGNKSLFSRNWEPIAKPCIANFDHTILSRNEFLSTIYIYFFCMSLVFSLFGPEYTLFSMARRTNSIGRHADLISACNGGRIKWQKITLDCSFYARALEEMHISFVYLHMLYLWLQRACLSVCVATLHIYKNYKDTQTGFYLHYCYSNLNNQNAFNLLFCKSFI